MSKKNKSIRVKLIANPGAGGVLEEASQIEQARRFLSDQGLQVDVALTKSIRKAIPIARKAVKDGYDVVIAMGGDGTLGAVIRGITDSKVKLGIIPAGTENDIARSLGIPEDLQEACALIASGHTRWLIVFLTFGTFVKPFFHNFDEALPRLDWRSVGIAPYPPTKNFPTHRLIV